MDLLIVALAAFAVTEFAKAAIPRPFPASIKMTFSLLLIAAWGVATSEMSPFVIWGVWGMSFLIHSLYRAVRSWSDAKRTEVMKTIPRPINIPNLPGH